MATQDSKPGSGPIGTCALAYYSFDYYAILLLCDKQLLTNILEGSEHITTTSDLGKENEAVEGSPTVRFAFVNEEIEPEKSLGCVSNRLPGNDEATLKELSKSLQGTQLQGRRMSHFAFEPVSLPASRVCLHLSSFKFSRPELQTSRDPEWSIGWCL